MKKRKHFSVMKVNDEVHKEAMRLKRELSVIENKDLSLNELCKRTLCNPEIQERLKIGSRERRRFEK